jgi:hypothetical protein
VISAHELFPSLRPRLDTIRMGAEFLRETTRKGDEVKFRVHSDGQQ